MIIVHYIPDVDQRSGGTSTYMRMVALALGQQVELHVFTHSSPNPLSLPHCRLHYLPRFTLTGWKKMVARQLTKVHPDVVHINGCWTPTCAIFQCAAQSLGIPVAITTHGMLEPWIMARHYYTRKWLALKLYQASALRRANMLVATAQREAANLHTLAYNRRVCVIHTGVNIGNIPVKKAWTKSNTMLFLGRIHQVKGIWCLLSAVRKARTLLGNYKLIIAGQGEGQDIDRINKYIAQWHLDGMVQYVGGVYGDDKWRLLQQADFLVQPSYTENFGLSVAEALASGTPVITTNGTPWHCLNTAHCGVCIDTGVESLEQTLAHFATLSAAELETMGRNGRQLIENNYSVQAMGKNMIQLYRSLKPTC